MKYISGATGYTILKRDEKVIILFGDIHDSVNYCKQGDESIDIDKYLDKKSNNYQVLLEESTNDPELNLSDLWTQSYHTNNLKNLKINNPNVIPVDIRPYLIPFSWQLVESNNKYKTLIFKKYISKFDEFLNKKGSTYLRFITPYFEYIINDEYKNKLEKVFSTIKKSFDKTFDKYLDETMEYVFNNNKEYLHKLDDINSLIMEYYILMLIFSDNRYSLIHTGLAHSSRLKYILKKIFNFKEIEDVMMTNIRQYKGDNSFPKACILNPDNSNYIKYKIFNSKYI